jgi:hypothetical protein
MIGFPPEPFPLRLQRLRPAPERPQHRSINKPYIKLRARVGGVSCCVPGVTTAMSFKPLPTSCA